MKANTKACLYLALVVNQNFHKLSVKEADLYIFGFAMSYHNAHHKNAKGSTDFGHDVVSLWMEETGRKIA